LKTILRVLEGRSKSTHPAAVRPQRLEMAEKGTALPSAAAEHDVSRGGMVEGAPVGPITTPASPGSSRAHSHARPGLGSPSQDDEPRGDPFAIDATRGERQASMRSLVPWTRAQSDS